MESHERSFMCGRGPASIIGQENRDSVGFGNLPFFAEYDQ